jgi:cytochrome c556
MQRYWNIHNVAEVSQKALTVASAFATDVMKTAFLAKTGNFAGARDAFRFARAHCKECHSKFLD